MYSLNKYKIYISFIACWQLPRKLCTWDWRIFSWKNYDIVDDPLANKDDSKKFEQSKDCFYLNIFYAIRHAVSGEYSHTEDSSCIDEGTKKCKTTN